ncbi:MAG TPA: hypothetical protein VKR61_02520 [Bryobacteraceae bacterium]|nr:hypothetical protein [Bryobacteraceae bacterium]
MRLWRVARILLGSCLVLYAVLTAALYWTMRQPLDRFGAIMRHVPGVAMAVLPFEPIWMRVRAGVLQPGDTAPDFELSTVDHSRRVRISEEFRNKPVVLIFGSYT